MTANGIGTISVEFWQFEVMRVNRVIRLIRFMTNPRSNNDGKRHHKLPQNSRNIVDVSGGDETLITLITLRRGDESRLVP
jgi:hypothetical protein